MNQEKRGVAKIIDIETSDLLSNMLDYTSFPYKLRKDAKLWCVVVRDAYTDEVFTAEKDEITKEWMQEQFKNCQYVIQHNGIKFDLLVLQLFGVLDYTVGYLGQSDTIFGQKTKIVDTLILSRLFNPDRFGGHSLSEWGLRTGENKMDFRGELIKIGALAKDDSKGEEFKKYHPLMLTYCLKDTEVNKNTFFALLNEMEGYKGWQQAILLENKLADLAVRRETLGFWFDKEEAIKCVEDLTQKMQELQDRVNPKLPPKPMNKLELNSFTPCKTQFLKSGKPSTHILKFAQRIGGVIMEDIQQDYYLQFEDQEYKLPHTLPLKTHVKADISNLDHVKMTLINDYNWVPIEWAERDFTKDSKKQSISFDKRVTAFERWVKETEEGKYKKLRLKIAFESFKVKNIDDLQEKVKERLEGEFPVRLPTSPKVRVGVEKDLCPNLIKLGDKVEFAKDFALFLTYKHRKSSIAGGEIEDMDFDLEAPNTGFLAMYREEDGRIPTPAIEIGAACVVRDSELLTRKGLQKIVDVKVGDEVLTHEGVYEKVTDIINNGIKPVYKITLENGFSLTSTDNHPYMTKEDGWVRLKDLDLKRHSILTYGEVEKWKNHSVFKNYSVSSWGRILNKNGKELKSLMCNNDLQVFVDLYDGEGNKKRQNIGKVVCETFNGECPVGLEVRHLDGNPYNNNIKNLKFGTSKENSQDALAHRYKMKKRRATVEKISDEEVIKIREHFTNSEYTRGDDKKFALKYGVSLKYMNEIRRGKRRVIVPSYTETYKAINIESIIFLGEQPTYDITVNKDHSYVVNNIVTHNTNRYRHIGVANIARASSVYGKEMRSLFGCGEGNIQLGFDYSSLENRVQGGYVKKYENGEELAEMLLAEKPNDLHSVNAKKLGISRSDAKSFGYAILYGASPKKLGNMLGVPLDKAKELYDNFWEAVPALKQLRDALTKHWEATDKKFIQGIDGRKIFVRSPHSLLNFLFQSGGVICAKYTTVFLMEELEKMGYCIDPFISQPSVCEMIAYHDEAQLMVKNGIISFETFNSEEEAVTFKNNWQGEGQLSTVKEGSKWYVALPSDVSRSIEKATKKTESLLNLHFELSFEYDVHRNWYGCH